MHQVLCANGSAVDLLGIGKFSVDSTKPLGSLATALSDEAKVTLDIANVLPRQATIELTPALTKPEFPRNGQHPS